MNIFSRIHMVPYVQYTSYSFKIVSMNIYT